MIFQSESSLNRLFSDPLAQGYVDELLPRHSPRPNGSSHAARGRFHNRQGYFAVRLQPFARLIAKRFNPISRLATSRADFIHLRSIAREEGCKTLPGFPVRF
jgi:hypothetical protein